MRRDEKTTAKKVLDLKVKGKRPRGRPQTSWLKYIDTILKERGTNLMKEVEDKWHVSPKKPIESLGENFLLTERTRCPNWSMV